MKEGKQDLSFENTKVIANSPSSSISMDVGLKIKSMLSHHHVARGMFSFLYTL